MQDLMFSKPSRRPLYRSLKAEGVTYETVHDELRRKMALNYLADRKVSVNETASLVGFSEPAAFSRAFKRWTGTIPRAVRKAYRRPPSVAPRAAPITFAAAIAKAIVWYILVFMAKNTSVSLGDHFTNFIERQISVGRFGSASEVLRAGLRLLEEHETKVETLRAALVEGEQSGSSPFDFDDFLARKNAPREG